MASGSGKGESPGGGGPLSVRVMQKLQGAVLTRSSRPRIFKVPNQLRQINEKAYEPEVIAIGPYHHGKDHLKAMEDHKLRHLKMLLDLESESEVERCVTALEEVEEKARNFYSEPLGIDREQFVEMMLLDGFFIIGLALSGWRSNVDDFVDDFLTPFTLRKVKRDLLLLENQLPLFVLSKLCSLIPLERAMHHPGRIMDHPPSEIIRFCLRVMASLLIKERVEYERQSELYEHRDDQHLLHLLRDLWSSPQCQENPSTTKWESLICTATEIFCDYLCSWRQSQRTLSTPEWQFIRSATELKEAGIKFRRNSGVLFDIKFQSVVISIPALTIDDDTESILRNLVAYEQCYEGNEGNAGNTLKCFTDYITFMDCLIKTGKDVELLCGVGVLENRLGDYEVVATMFNRLRDSVLISEKRFLYSEIFNRVNKHCDRECNKQMAILRHDYFHNPGAFISLTSAIFLFLCTLLQTLFSILSYRHQIR